MNTGRNVAGGLLAATAIGAQMLDLPAVWPHLSDSVPALISALALVSVFVVAPRRSELSLVPTLARIVAISWVAWAAIGISLSADPRKGLIALVAAVGTALTALTVHLRRGWAAVAVLAVVSLGVFGALSFVAALTSDHDGEDPYLRLASLEANRLAMASALALLLVMATFLEQRTIDETPGSKEAVRDCRDGQATPTWAAVLVAMALLAVLLLTRGRMAIAALLAGSVVALIMRRQLVIAGSVVAGAAVLLATLLALGGRGGTFASARSELLDGGTSLTGRSDLWPLLIEQVARRPLVGSGLGTGRDLVVNAVSGELGWAPQHAHNLAVHSLLETGIVGSALLGVAALLALLRSCRRREVVSVAVLTFLAVGGVTEVLIEAGSLGWTVLAVAVLTPANALGGVRPPPNGSARMLAAGVMLALATVVTVAEPANLPHAVRCRHYGHPGGEPLPDGRLRIDRSVLDQSNVGDSSGALGLDGSGWRLDERTGNRLRCAALVEPALVFTMRLRDASSTSEELQPIFSLGNAQSWTGLDLQISRSADRLVIYVRDSPYTRQEVWLPEVFDGEWQDLVVRIERRRVDVFRDDQVVARRNLGGNDPMAWRIDQEAWFGSRPGGGGGFVGEMEFFEAGYS